MIRRLPILLLIACSLVLAACGQEEVDRTGGFQSENAQVAETEGIYLDVEGAKYQVQLSRQLNPALPDDGPYIRDINTSENRLEGDQVWFAVFMRVENDSDETIESARRFVIRDTQENEFLPVSIEPTNEWSYQPVKLAPKHVYPGPNTPAGERSPNGALLLFRVNRPSLDNRPLELEVTGPKGEKAIVDLDV
jgi:hypothetical protein